MRELCMILLFLSSALSHEQEAVPIWHSNNLTTQFVMFRSPLFSLDLSTIQSARLAISARQSAREPPVIGTTQSKLLGAYKLFVDGIMVTMGPGHNVPSNTQSLDFVDILRVLRPAPATNVLAAQCFFANNTEQPDEIPRLYARLEVEFVNGSNATLVPTGPGWMARAADDYMNPVGDCGHNWYHMPDEYLDRRRYPVGWNDVDFTQDERWEPAVEQPDFPQPLQAKSIPPPAMLVRGVCNVSLVGAGRGREAVYLLDFGQEMMGGVLLSFNGSYDGIQVEILYGEQLNGSVLMFPMRTGNAYRDVWTLSGSPAANVDIAQHEFIQFRYAQVSGSPEPLTSANTRAWIVQYPVAGTGENPWEIPCARSTPTVPSNNSSTCTLASFESSDPHLDAVWNLTAYTMLATSLELNVDSQTRQRDLCHIDALITAHGQFSVFCDASLQQRTFTAAFDNDTAIWPASAEFKMSTALMAFVDAQETGSLSLCESRYASNIMDTNNSLQFMSNVRYFNKSLGMLDYTSGCGGSWGCSPLIDWPVNTQDGYVNTSVDSIRNGLGAFTINALADVAGWLGHPDDAELYRTISGSIAKGLPKNLLRVNGSEAYFVDGIGTEHAAVHSTVYAVIAGVVDLQPSLAAPLLLYLQRRGMGAASCMTSRWFLQALYDMGTYDASSADYAYELLTGQDYPGWGYMISIGATTTLEAWRPADKWNCDWAHPWCASPAFIVPRLLVGIRPLEPGWARFQFVPQPSTLSVFRAVVPTVLGPIEAWLSGGSTYGVTVPASASCQVCLPSRNATAASTLVVDGHTVPSVLWRRFLCTVSDLLTGTHIITRV